MENKIDYLIPDETVTEVAALIKQIQEKLKPYLIALTPEERQSLPKMSDGTSPFVQKCLEFCSSDPQFAPPYLDVAGFQSDMTDWNKLMSIYYPIMQLAQDLDDTTLEAGSESYSAALTYYNSVKQAAKMSVPGSKPIYDDLKKRFTSNGERKNTATEV